MKQGDRKYPGDAPAVYGDESALGVSPVGAAIGFKDNVVDGGETLITKLTGGEGQDVPGGPLGAVLGCYVGRYCPNLIGAEADPDPGYPRQSIDFAR